MSEDKKEESSPTQSPPEEEKKKAQQAGAAQPPASPAGGQNVQAPPPVTQAIAAPPAAGQPRIAQAGPPPAPLPPRQVPAGPATVVPPRPAAQSSTPGPAAAPLPGSVAAAPLRPPVAPVTRPTGAPPPPPPSRPKPAENAGRRNFVKALVTVGAVLSLVPFVPWGQFLSSSVGSTGALKRQKVTVDNDPKACPIAAAGRVVNVNDLTTFPPDHHWVVTYPSSGDPTLDHQNPDTFVKFELIRLPTELGGGNKDATAFVAFSKVCVHLWCSPNYHPSVETCDPAHPTGDQRYDCPCHGSIYAVPDGKAVLGPASLQPAPTNAIPMLTLTTDSSGVLYIEPPLWDIDHNGVIGYGRNYQSYDSYIKPTGKASG